MNRYRLKAYIYLLVASLIWAFAGIVIKETLQELTPGVFLTYRFLISTVVMLPFVIFRKNKPLNTKSLLLLIICSILGTTINIGLLFYGTNLTTVNDMAVITAIAPIMVIIAGAIFLKEHITSREKLGISITLLGTILLVLQPIIITHGDGFASIQGNLLLILANLGWVGYVLLAKKLTREKIDTLTLTFFGFLVGFLTLLPAAILERGSLSQTTDLILHASISTHTGVWYMAIFSGVIAYLLYNLGQKTIEVSESALFSYLQAIFTIPLGVILLGEELTIPFLVGAGIIVIGVTIAELKSGSKR